MLQGKNGGQKPDFLSGLLRIKQRAIGRVGLPDLFLNKQGRALRRMGLPLPCYSMGKLEQGREGQRPVGGRGLERESVEMAIPKLAGGSLTRQGE